MPVARVYPARKPTYQLMKRRLGSSVLLVVFMSILLTGCIVVGPTGLGLLVLLLIIDLIVIRDVARTSHTPTAKAVWILIVMQWPILGIALYYWIGRNKEE